MFRLMIDAVRTGFEYLIVSSVLCSLAYAVFRKPIFNWASNVSLLTVIGTLVVVVSLTLPSLHPITALIRYIL